MVDADEYRTLKASVETLKNSFSTLESNAQKARNEIDQAKLEIGTFRQVSTIPASGDPIIDLNTLAPKNSPTFTGNAVFGGTVTVPNSRAVLTDALNYHDISTFALTRTMAGGGANLLGTFFPIKNGSCYIQTMSVVVSADIISPVSNFCNRIVAISPSNVVTSYSLVAANTTIISSAATGMWTFIIVLN